MTRAALLVALVLLGACVESASVAPEPEPNAEAPPQAAPPPRDPMLAELAARAVYDDDFVRPVLYTWTTLDKLATLRASRQLLVADAKTQGWSSPFNRALADIPSDGSLVAELAERLREDPELRRHRYAWPNPFATTMGLGERRYGDSLVRIELAPEAWIGRFEPNADPPFRFVDLEGAPVELAEVVAEPTRLAALFHVNGPPRERLAFREYVICSEAMVREWSIATEEIRALVEAEAALLEQLRERTFAVYPREAIGEAAQPDWASLGKYPTALSLWHATLAFDNERYRPGRRELSAIIETLARLEDDGGPPLCHRPRSPEDGSRCRR